MSHPCQCGKWRMPRDIHVDDDAEANDRLELRITVVCPMCGRAWSGIGRKVAHALVAASVPKGPKS